MEKEILELFKAVVIDTASKTTEFNVDFIEHGLILNFTPAATQLSTLISYFKPLDIKTLFTREERDNSEPHDLIMKQFMHYVEVYGLKMPGLFNLETSTGTIITMNFVRGITVNELNDMVCDLLYSNAPVKDATAIKSIIDTYSLVYDVNKILNNELRVVLFNANVDIFEDGDDAVRYMCYAATGQSLLIKSEEVIAAIKETKFSATFSATFFTQHENVLANVFNRHKRLILAAKNSTNCTVINRISRKSKTMHIPLHESVNKTFITKALAGNIDLTVLSQIGLRDKFKYLNLLAYKYEQSTVDAFVIRNGKMHIKTNRKIWSKTEIARVEEAVLDSIKHDLQQLVGKRILLDAKVRYGLPISRKQAMGNLPFGTKVGVESKRISSGIYWENDWGASDLDLSTIDPDGNRTGWGQYSGYNRNNPITFSGDITSARNGAMEFMTSAKSDYGLFVNIYSGQLGTEMEIVVGNDADDDAWISDVIIREKHKLNSRGSLVGFVRNNEFIVYSGRLGGSHISGRNQDPVVTRGLSNFWTVNDLFDILDIKYDVDKDDKVQYNYNLSYDGFSFEKLEDLLLK